MRNFVLGMVGAIILLPAASLGYFALGFSQVPSDVAPSEWETRVMKHAVRASLRRAASGISVPKPATPGMLVAGGKLYVAGCVGCHGDLRKPLQEDHANFPPVPQLPSRGTSYSEPELYCVVKHGVRMTSMSAYGQFYSEQQLWALAAFLHQIKTLPPEVVDSIYSK